MEIVSGGDNFYNACFMKMMKLIYKKTIWVII